MEFSITSKAQLKILLHAAKHPWSSINGALIGVDEGKTVSVIDAIPIAHTPILGSSLEASLTIIESYCNSEETPKDTRIVGWYYGSSRNNEAAIPSYVKKIANKIESNNAKKSSCLVVIDNPNFGDESKPGIEVMTKIKDNWQTAPKVWICDEKASIKFTELLRGKVHENIVDFDDWYEAPQATEWRNKTLVLS